MRDSTFFAGLRDRHMTHDILRNLGVDDYSLKR